MGDEKKGFSWQIRFIGIAENTEIFHRELFVCFVFAQHTTLRFKKDAKLKMISKQKKKSLTIKNFTTKTVKIYFLIYLSKSVISLTRHLLPLTSIRSGWPCQ